MKSRAQRAATADLFAAAAAIAPAAPALRAPPPAPRPLLARSTPLWHAVVFSQLKLNDSSTPLERLCMHAQQFTSRVSVQMPDALLLEVKGSVKLFGSLMQLQAAIEGAWSGLKLPVQSATAPSALAALWLARAGERALVEEPQSLAGALAQLPIACTAWDEERLRTLRSMGITRMGELLRLPRAGLARRVNASTNAAISRRPSRPLRTSAPRCSR